MSNAISINANDKNIDTLCESISKVSLDTSTISTTEALNRNNRLIILDINGLLCTKVNNDVELSEEEKKIEVIPLSFYRVLLRPYCREFLSKCYSVAKVGYLSSTTFANANEILNVMLTPKQNKDTLFKWYRDRTHFDPDSINDPSSYKTIKLLSDIIDNPIINKDHIYTYNNVLLVDDCKIKTRFNNSKNICIVSRFLGDSKDDVLLHLDIDKRFADLVHNT